MFKRCKLCKKYAGERESVQAKHMNYYRCMKIIIMILGPPCTAYQNHAM